LIIHIIGLKENKATMKIILSRKGFDNQYGGQPSPILPDGTLLSLPIPAKDEKVKFNDLKYNEKSYFEIIKELKPNTKIKENYTCHLDPDLRKDILNRPSNWKPLFGQTGSSQGHLRNNDIGINDLFLFFGTFRHTEYKNNKISYMKNSPDIHLIYGYLQIQNLNTDIEKIKRDFSFHPHSQNQFIYNSNNCIYEANDKLDFNEKVAGFGLMSFHEDLVLTKNDCSKSKWSLPSFFKDIEISYHSINSFKENYFQSASKGQEFIISENKLAKKWAENIIVKGTKYNRVALPASKH